MICVSLVILKLVTSICLPKDTLVTPVKFVPVRVTLKGLSPAALIGINTGDCWCILWDGKSVSQDTFARLISDTVTNLDPAKDAVANHKIGRDLRIAGDIKTGDINLSAKGHFSNSRKFVPVRVTLRVCPWLTPIGTNTGDCWCIL